MPNFSHVTLIGHLTRDPEIRYGTTGTAITSFCVAVSNKYKDKEETAFIDVTAFGKTAENCGKYLVKGLPVHVSGRLTQDNWEDKTSGQKRSKLKVVADQVQFLGKVQESNPDEVDEGDCPF